MTATPTPTHPTSSTTVRRKKATARLLALRAAFAVLDRTAPEVGARWALRIWCTLPATAGRRRDERPRAGTRADVLLPDGGRLAVETWGDDDDAPVYLAHGWGGWRGQLGAFVDPLVAAGRRVVAFDAPSHGDSSPGGLGPGRSTAVELADGLAAVAAVHGTPDAVIAHSLGCAAIALALHDGLPARRLALIAPSADPIGMTENLAAMLGYGERTKRRFLDRLEHLAGRPLSDFGLTTLSGTAPPTLIVHDRDDKEVPYTDGAGLAEAWPTAELVTTEGLGHQRILRDPAVVERLTRFLTV